MRNRLKNAPIVLQRTIILGLICSIAAGVCGAVELKISRTALQRTLEGQLFGGAGGRYYLRGTRGSACAVYAEKPLVRFTTDRIVVKVQTHARIGTSIHGVCMGISLSPESEVSMAPEGEGETLGFRDARLDRVSSQRELNFLLAPFLSHTVPSNMKVNAAELLRRALEGSTASSGYRVTLQRLKIHSVQIAGDDLVVDCDGDLDVN